ncbi:MAG: hypothetical protein ACOYYJ_07690 [Chloroflexota bacterium]
MLSKTSRWLAYTTALLYGVTGFWLYVFPEPIAPVFAWKVTPFMSMTIGGWALGNAWLAYLAARRWAWSRVYTTLLYLWLFGISEMMVVFFFRDKLALAHPIAWLYLSTLVINVITALAGMADWLRLRPSIHREGRQVQPLHRWLALAFVLFVGFLGIYGLTAQIGWPGTNGGIFPEVMSLFTLRSFGAFYFSLALAALPFLWEKNLETVLHHGFAAFGLIAFVTIAAFAYLRLFDFSARPGGILYIAVYLLVGIPLLFAFRKLGFGNA